MAGPLQDKIVISADDKTGAALAAAAARFKAFGGQIKALAGRGGLPRLAGAVGNVGGAMAGVARSIAPVVRGLTEIAGIGAGAGLAGIGIALKSSATALDDMAKKARQLGLTTQQLRRFNYVAEQQDVAWENASAGLTKAVKSYDEIRTGVGRASAVLKKIEPVLAMQIKRAHSSGEAINLMVSSIHQAIKVGNKARALKLASIFFGDEDFTKIAELTKAETEAMNRRSEFLQGSISDEAAAKMDAFNDSLTDIQFAIRGVSDAVAVTLLPQVTDLNLAFADWIAVNRESDDAMTKTAKGMRGLTPKIGIVERIGNAFRRLKTWMGEVNWERMGQRLVGFGEAANKVAGWLGGWDNVMLGLAALPFAGIAASVAVLGKTFVDLAIAINATPIGRLLAVVALLGAPAWQNWEKLGPIADDFGAKIKAWDFSGALKSFKEFDAEYTAGVRRMAGLQQNVSLNPSFDFGRDQGRKFRDAMDRLFHGRETHNPGTQGDFADKMRLRIKAMIDGIKGMFDIDLSALGRRMLESFWRGILSFKDKLIAGVIGIGEAIAKALTAPGTVKPLNTLPTGAPELGAILNNLEPRRQSSPAGRPRLDWQRPITIPEDLRNRLQMPSAPIGKQPERQGNPIWVPGFGSDALPGGAGNDQLADKQQSVVGGNLALSQAVRGLTGAIQQLSRYIANLGDGTGGLPAAPSQLPLPRGGSGGGPGRPDFFDPGTAQRPRSQIDVGPIQPGLSARPSNVPVQPGLSALPSGKKSGTTVTPQQAAAMNGIPAPGEQGQFRPVYKLGDADLSPGVVNTIAGEARLKDPRGVDAVVNNLFNRLGTKAYGPSANLYQVARSQGVNGRTPQYAGYRQATEKQAEMIKARIRAIASGAVPDITKGSNEYRAASYNGPWMRKTGRPFGTDIGGNVFARNPKADRSPYAAYSEEELARRAAARPEPSPEQRPAPRPEPNPSTVAYGGAAAQKVDIGKGSFDMRLRLDPSLQVRGVKVEHPENAEMSVGVDRTGAPGWRPGGMVP